MSAPHRVCLEKGSVNWEEDFSYLHLRRYLRELQEGRLNRDTDKIQKIAIAAIAQARRRAHIARTPTRQTLPMLPEGALERFQVAEKPASEQIVPEAAVSDGATDEMPAIDMAIMQRESDALKVIRESTPRQTGSMPVVTSEITPLPELILLEEVVDVATEPKTFVYHDPEATPIGLHAYAITGFLEAHKGTPIAYVRMAHMLAWAMIMAGVDLDPECLKIDNTMDHNTIVVVGVC